MEATGQATRARRWLGLGLLCSAFLIDVMGSTSVFTASPEIQRDVGLAGFAAAFAAGGVLALAGLRGGRSAAARS